MSAKVRSTNFETSALVDTADDKSAQKFLKSVLATAKGLAEGMYCKAFTGSESVGEAVFSRDVTKAVSASNPRRLTPTATARELREIWGFCSVCDCGRLTNAKAILPRVNCWKAF